VNYLTRVRAEKPHLLPGQVGGGETR